MKRITLTLVVALLLGTLSLSAQRGEDEAVAIETLVAGEGENKIITTGYGMTHEEAEQDALRNAVSEAVGSVVSSSTTIVNDEIVTDEILSLSHGFVKAHKAISAKGNATDGFEVTIVAIVTRSQLIETLATQGVKVEYNAGGIFAKYNEWDRLKQDELAMVNKFFGPEAIERRSSNVYNYELRLGEPLRQGDKYKVEVGIVATENANYEAEFDYFKAVLAELSYEVAPLTYLMPTIHLQEGLPDAMRYTLKYPNGVNRKGRTKYKTHLLDICEFDAPRQRNMLSPSSAYRSCGSGDFTARFIGTNENYATTLLLYNKYNKHLTTQDISRLNYHRISQECDVFDFFQRSYTPFVFVLVEEANALTPYRRITFYKFINQESLDVVKNYLYWMFGEMHCDIVIDYTNDKKVFPFENNDRCVLDVVERFDGRLHNNGPVRMRYEGYTFMRPTHSPVEFSQTLTFTFSPERFSTIRNIELVPHQRVDNLREAIK